jgi:hypothetical protein
MKARTFTAALTSAAALLAGAASLATAPAASAATVAQSCHPLTDGGKCYEPGEFCRSGDHDVTGLAGDGKAIVCWDNDGWRWEPVSSVTLSCKILDGGLTGLELSVTATTGTREYLGILSVSFSDYTGSGHKFPGARVYPDRYASPAAPYHGWTDVPAADIDAGAHPSHCTASV